MELGSIIGLELFDEDVHYTFPTFYYSLGEKKFYFKSLSLELGSLNFVIGERKVGKTLFMRSLTGLECPNEKPLERNFLNYDIVYKPEFIEPKFNGSLNELIISKKLDENSFFMKNISKLDLLRFLDVSVRELGEEQKQLLSFCIFLSTEGLIYVMDSPSYLISESKRGVMYGIFKNFCEKNDKIGLITEDNEKLVDEVIDERLGRKYFIKKFSENEFYGGDMYIENN